MKLAKAGRHEAMCCAFEWIITTGRMVCNRTRRRVLNWLHRALEAGSPDAARILGRIYVYGNGVNQDVPWALEYDYTATELGDVQFY